MAFPIPASWSVQSGFQVLLPVRAVYLSDLIENDRYICATRRPGYGGAWPYQYVKLPSETVASFPVYRPASGDTLRLYVWGDGIDVDITDGITTATASCAGTGSPTLAYADLSPVASGWVDILIKATPTGSTQVLSGWQLVDGDLDAGDLPA